jgi:hypothetical protein
MKMYLLALALELFVDWAPENTSVEGLPFAGELQPLLQKRGYELHTWEKKPEDTWVFFNLGLRLQGENLEGRDLEKMVLFMWEPPTVQPELYDPKVQAQFGKIFTWDDDLVDGKRFFKFCYPALQARLDNLPLFEEKKFCTLIGRRLSSKHPKQLYSERENTIRFFEDKVGEFDLYGPFWEKRKFKNWRGAIPDKLAVLKNYKYCICYENTRDVKGYISEKIFDCFAAGVVPVYWGASNVEKYIPPRCFIDRRKFKTNKQLYQFLKKITKEEYAKYLESASAFLKSEEAKAFTAERFIETFILGVIQESGDGKEAP